MGVHPTGTFQPSSLDTLLGSHVKRSWRNKYTQTITVQDGASGVPSGQEQSHASAMNFALLRQSKDGTKWTCFKPSLDCDEWHLDNINLHHRWTSSICYREALTWVRWPSYAWAMGPLRPVNPSSQTVCWKDVCIMHVMMYVFSVRHLAIITSCKCRGQIKTKAINVHLFHPIALCTGIGGSGISWNIVIHCDACSSSVLCIVSGS